MSDFSADWLAQREAIDDASRSIKLTNKLRQRIDGYSALRIVDLATGTGANLRYLAPRLNGHQEWLLVDHDANLLSEVPRHINRWAKENGFSLIKRAQHTIISGTSFECRLSLLNLDLAMKLDRLPLEDCHLVTASALLDLVSARWLDRLVERCRSARVVVLFVLTYDGHIVWNPGDPEDEFVTELVNRHQRTNKGFGPALGPTATQTSIARLMDRGYHVHSHPSEWHLEPRHPVLQQELLKGWTEASLELQSESLSWIQAWAQRRRTHIHAGRSSLIVGHTDILGWPT